MRWLAVAALVAITSTLTATQASSQTANHLAQTPPMGWNSWNHFAGKVTEQDVKDAADALVQTGMRDAGYLYVNVDDTWEGKRDATGVLHPNDKFPDMKGLGDYIHARGLKFGIYSSPGPLTCGHYEGSYQHEQQDADLYASWGVDYLKYDLCDFRDVMAKGAAAHPNDPGYANQMMKDSYAKMRRALDHTGRPIVLSLCQYGDDNVWTWGAAVGGNLWRTTGDINDTYARMSEIGFNQSPLAKYAGAGHWNDPDMLEVGNGGMSTDEYRTHMSLWALLAAPLLAGNDLSRMSPEAKSILMNKAVIAVDQDPLGKQGTRVSQTGGQTRNQTGGQTGNHTGNQAGGLEVWSKPLAGGALAVGLFNRSTSTATVTATLAELHIKARSIIDLWTGKPVTAANGTITASVPAHGVALLRIAP